MTMSDISSSSRLLPALLFATMLFAAPLALAWETITASSATGDYALRIDMDRCVSDALHSPGTCGGPVRVSLHMARMMTPAQVIDLPNMEIRRASLVRDSDWSNGPVIGLNTQYSVVFADFNFDAWPDMAIATGMNGEYGSLSYTVFLFDKRTGRFVDNPAFSALTVGASGVTLHPATSQIFVTRKNDGPHEDKIYKVEYNRPIMIQSTTESVGTYTVHGHRVLEFKTLRKQFQNGRWQTTIERSFEGP